MNKFNLRRLALILLVILLLLFILIRCADQKPNTLITMISKGSADLPVMQQIQMSEIPFFAVGETSDFNSSLTDPVNTY